MDANELTRLKGWRGLVMALHDWLGEHGFTNLARWLTHALNGTLSEQAQADLFAANIVKRAREFVRNGPPGGNLAGATALSQLRRLADDLPAQERWLNTEARARGFKDIEDLLARDYPLFEKLAALWRKKHPAEVMFSRDGTLRAPNGKPSNLNAAQWRQVRTPEFKAWFGDWEIAAQPQRDASTFSAAREAAKAFQGKPLVSRDGVTATVSRSNLDKMLSASAVHKSESAAEHALAVANLDTLFAMAETGWTKTDREGDQNIKAIHRLFAPMRVNGKARLVKLTVKEYSQAAHGNRVYSVDAVEVKEGSPVPEMVDADRADGSRLLTGPTGLAESMVERIKDFNQRGASKVVDENGEPRVVYHGTTREFNVFEPVWKQLERIAHPHELKPGGAMYDYYTRAKSEPEMHFFGETDDLAQSYAEANDNGRVIQAFLKIANPVMGEEYGQDARDAALDAMLKNNNDGARFYDTSITGRWGGMAWAVRTPTQIKSATGNRGTFDPATPDIRLSRATQPDAAQRADAILADTTAKWRPLDAMARAGVKMVHFDRATKAIYAKAGKLLDVLTPEKIRLSFLLPHRSGASHLSTPLSGIVPRRERHTLAAPKDEWVLTKAGVLAV
jgi:hypothetical protein